MSLLVRLLAGDFEESAGTPPPHSPFWYLDDPGAASMAGVNVSGASAQRVSTVFWAFRKISTVLASLPVHLYRERPDGGRERVTDHPAVRWLRRPNKWQTRSQWTQVTEGHILLRGNGYSRLFEGPDGYFAGEAWPLHPDRTRVVDQLGDGTLVYGWRGKDGQEQILRQDQVLHLPGPSDDGIRGMDVLRLMRNSVGLSLAMESYASRFFSNGASPSLVLKHPGILGEGMDLKLANQVAAKTSGDNAHLPLVLEDGLSVEKLGLDNEQAQFLESRSFQVVDLLRFLDIPEAMVPGAQKSATYASAEQFFLSFVTHCLQPIAVAREQKMTMELLVEGEEKLFFKFNLDALKRGDTEARSAYYEKALKNRWMTPNEVRALEEMNPVPWGDEPLPIQGATSGPVEDPAAGGPPPPAAPSEPEEDPEEERDNRPRKRRKRS